MRIIAYKKNLIDSSILELIMKLEELKLRIKKAQELFFDMNLNTFKKYEPEGGK